MASCASVLWSVTNATSARPVYVLTAKHRDAFANDDGSLMAVIQSVGVNCDTVMVLSCWRPGSELAHLLVSAAASQLSLLM
jgi:hypothetical protein